MDHHGNEKEATQDPGIPREEYPEYGCSRAAKIHVILHARDERLCRGKKIEMSMCMKLPRMARAIVGGAQDALNILFYKESHILR